jgi:hypothetical protein
MWYLLVIERLKHMFSIPRGDELLLWHVNRKTDGKIWHPVDGKKRKYFDLTHQEDFSNDPRNIKFRHSTNGINPFGEMRNSHSTWPDIMCIFNLPHGCATNESIFYWQHSYPVLNKLAWFRTIDGGHAETLEIWDEYNKQHFNLKAIIFYMINDNIACLSLTGQVKGKTTCVVCVDQTESIYLPSSSKLVYMWHHRFLPRKHKYRQWKTWFDGTIKNEKALKHRDENFVFEIIKNIKVIFWMPVKGKKRKKNERAPKDCPLKKQSIFFTYLPYWKEFKISHVIDIIHVEKGVFESTIGLLLDITGKTKDGFNARKDIQALWIREELHPQERSNGKVYLPPTRYTLINMEKRAICKCLDGIRVPTCFLTNIKNLVSMSELKMRVYIMHYCHTMLSLFLAIAIRAINHPYVKMVITHICHFFNAISKKVINVIELDELHKEMQVTMC